MAYLHRQVGRRLAAAIAGLASEQQISRYSRENGPHPHRAHENRLREGDKVVHMLAKAYGAGTARAWLCVTNTGLDDHAPVEILGEAKKPADFARVVAMSTRAGPGRAATNGPI